MDRLQRPGWDDRISTRARRNGLAAACVSAFGMGAGADEVIE